MMQQPTITDEAGAIIFDFGDGASIETRDRRKALRGGVQVELRVVDAEAVIGLATVSLGDVAERARFIKTIQRRDGNVPDWDARLLVVTDYFSRHQEASVRPGTLASAVKPQVVDWLWRWHIPAARLSMLGGDPDIGKSLTQCDLAARVSVGGPWPDGSGNAPLGWVLMLTAEDSLEDTVVPRLIRCGADLDRIQLIGPQDVPGYFLPTGVEPLEERIRELKAKGDGHVFVCIDPLDVFVPGVDTHRASEVRGALAPMEALAQRTGAAIQVVSHLNKNSKESNVLYRFGGALAFIAAARSALLAAFDPDDPEEMQHKRRRIFGAVKMNLGPKPRPLAYHVVDPGVISWEGPIDRSLGALLQSANQVDAPKLAEAQMFLSELLSEGRVLVQMIQKEARDTGLSWDTVKRAKQSLGIEAHREGESGRRGGGAWYWDYRVGDDDLVEHDIDSDAPLNELTPPSTPLNTSRYESKDDDALLNSSPGPQEVKESIEGGTSRAHASAADRDYCFGLARTLGFPKIELGPGRTVPAGEVACMKFVENAYPDDLAAAQAALDRMGAEAQEALAHA